MNQKKKIRILTIHNCEKRRRRADVCKVCGKEGENIRDHIEVNHYSHYSYYFSNLLTTFLIITTIFDILAFTNLHFFSGQPS